jgi:hypothetical protein
MKKVIFFASKFTKYIYFRKTKDEKEHMIIKNKKNRDGYRISERTMIPFFVPTFDTYPVKQKKNDLINNEKI